MERLIAPRPIVRVEYGHADVTSAIDEFLHSVEFTDHLEGQPDSLEVVLEDREGLFRGRFWPLKGDDIGVAFGYDSGPLDGLWPMGMLVLDEAEVGGPPSTVTLRALATSVKEANQRTIKSRAFENQKLEDVVSALGAGGKVPDLTFKRITQSNETDLAFLARLAKKFGLVMKFRDGDPFLFPFQDLLGGEALVTLEPPDVTRWHLRSKTADTPAAHVSRRWSPQTKRLVDESLTDLMQPTDTKKHPVPNSDKVFQRQVLPAEARLDVGKLLDRVEDTAQAEARVAAATLRAGMGEMEGNFEVPGDPRLRAGMVVTIRGFGDQLDREYLAVRVRHSFRRGAGYLTEMDVSSTPRKSAGQRTHKPGKSTKSGKT